MDSLPVLPGSFPTGTPDGGPGIDFGAPDLPTPARMAGLAAEVSPDAVLTAVIDIGLSPVHARLRQDATKTRVLSAWQQAGRYMPGGTTSFGSEVLRPEINAALAAPAFDERAFLAAHGVTRADAPLGPRELDKHHSHGAHMADLACGGAMQGQGALTSPVLLVNLPPRYSVGSGGAYLELFALAAIKRCIAFADALWTCLGARQGTSKWADAGGFPLVINFSFGMQAGPKSGNGWLERQVAHALARRTAPTDICIPAGNDTLARGTATARLEQGWPSVRFPLRVPPGDLTPNFVELWTGPLTDPRADITVTVTPPGAATPLSVPATPGATAEQALPADPTRVTRFQMASDPAGSGNEVATPSPAVSLYRTRWADPGGTHQHRLILALMPTAPEAGGGGAPIPATPSGLWTIEVAAAGAPVDISLHVQTDQDVRPGTGGEVARCYVDAAAYDTHTRADEPVSTVPIGQPRDSYHVAPVFGGAVRDLDDWTTQGPTQRKGSQNALSTFDAAFVAGAYVRADKRPARYSGTAPATANTPASAPGAPRPSGITALLPGDDGPMAQGILAAGSRSGSASVLQGTSAASALAAREMVAWLHGRRSGLDPATGRTWSARAGIAALARAAPSDAASVLKSGVGPVPSSYATDALRHRPGW
ncbi:MAG: hypothetical protein ACU0CI_02535 [Shimia sp.]